MPEMREKKERVLSQRKETIKQEFFLDATVANL